MDYRLFAKLPSGCLSAGLTLWTGRNGRLAVIACILTPLLTSCAALNGARPPIPYPVLESATVNEQGGICIDKADTERLLRFIDELKER